jgi:serine/threonine-protein kinase
LKLPKALETLVMSCLAKAPDDRPQSVADILEVLDALGKRYKDNPGVGKRIADYLEKMPTPIQGQTKPLSDRVPLIDEICKLAVWPKNKPIAQIVFAQSLTTETIALPAVWVMLPQQEIQTLQTYRLYNVIYKNFLYAMSPHPTLLWVTGIYNRQRHQQKNNGGEAATGNALVALLFRSKIALWSRNGAPIEPKRRVSGLALCLRATRAMPSCDHNHH